MRARERVRKRGREKESVRGREREREGRGKSTRSTLRKKKYKKQFHYRNGFRAENKQCKRRILNRECIFRVYNPLMYIISWI